MNSNQPIRLAGQVAIVTGGGRGIGQAMALALAKAGASVAVVARSQDQLAETVALTEQAGGCAVAFPADVTDQQAVERMAAAVEENLGPVDLLVSNAGVYGPIGPAWEVDADAWWQCVNVNLRGPYLCARAVLPGMIGRRRGRIITTASGAGLRTRPRASSYAVGKCAVIRLTENLAAETAEHGISVFAINPGFVRTALTESAAESPEDAKWLGGIFRKLLAEGRDVPPERVAELVITLASGKADALSGRNISVDDDVDEMIRRVKEAPEDDLYTLRLRR